MATHNVCLSEGVGDEFVKSHITKGRRELWPPRKKRSDLILHVSVRIVVSACQAVFIAARCAGICFAQSSAYLRLETSRSNLVSKPTASSRLFSTSSRVMENGRWKLTSR